MIDIPNSLVLVFEGRVSTRLAHWMRVAAASLPMRAAFRALGCLAAPLHLTGRITVWAQKPMG
jgi:hypothetical protein